MNIVRQAPKVAVVLALSCTQGIGADPFESGGTVPPSADTDATVDTTAAAGEGPAGTEGAEHTGGNQTTPGSGPSSDSSDDTTDPSGPTDPSGSTGTSSTGVDSSTTDGLDQEFPAGDSVWSGVYSCDQGLTRLDLELNHVSGLGLLTGVFSFSAHPMGPDLPSGSFNVAGSYDATTEGIRLDPVSWIEQPDETWVMIGLEGTYDPHAAEISGTVLADICSTFEVTRRS